jgi:uncharacterized surface protein with fasciclin (FAS1) repeats
VKINDAIVTKDDVEGSNVVIHIINSVSLPTLVIEQLPLVFD